MDPLWKLMMFLNGRPYRVLWYSVCLPILFFGLVAQLTSQARMNKWVPFVASVLILIISIASNRKGDNNPRNLASSDSSASRHLPAETKLGAVLWVILGSIVILANIVLFGISVAYRNSNLMVTSIYGLCQGALFLYAAWRVFKFNSNYIKVFAVASIVLGWFTLIQRLTGLVSHNAVFWVGLGISLFWILAGLAVLRGGVKLLTIENAVN